MRKLKFNNKADGGRSFEKNSTISLAVVILGSFMGGIFQILSGRIINDVFLYADLNAIFSMQTILVLPTTIITYVITKYTAEFYGRKQLAEMKGFLYMMGKPLLVLVGIVFVSCLVGIGIISNILHIDNRILIILTITNVAISFLLPLVNGTLQGMQLFVAYGLISIFGQGFKLIGMILAGVCPYKLEIILFVVVLGTFFSIVYGLIVVKHQLAGTSMIKCTVAWNAIMKYAFSVLWANFALTMLTNIDMILIKYFFNDNSGYYSVALVLGRLVYYFASAMAVVLFPMVVGAGRESSLKLLLKSVLYNSVLAIVAIFALNLMGKYIVFLCYGELYMDAVQYIFPITCLIFPINIITLVINYLLAQNRGKRIIGITIVGIIAEILSVCLYHEVLLYTIWIMVVIVWGILVVDIFILLQGEKWK